MDLDFAFLADYAVQDGKVTAVGIGFNTIHAPDIPWVHPQMAVVVRLRASVAETGAKKCSLRMIDADGQDVIPAAEMELTFQPPQEGTESTNTLVANINNLEFPHHGSYAVHVVVDGHEMARVPFRVAPPPATV